MQDAQAAIGHSAAGELVHPGECTEEPIEILKPQPKSISVGCILAIIVFLNLPPLVFTAPGCRSRYTAIAAQFNGSHATAR